MPKTPCKGLRKDGKPCQGHGLPDFDGYCIAHVPAHIASEWRSRGGKASSNAARADKRIPERLRAMNEKLSEAMDDLIEGKIDPAALTALYRAARVQVEIYRLSDQEMDLIRAEESAAAAAQVAGVPGEPAILDAAAAITDWQNDYILNSLIDQGLVTPERDQTQELDDPPAHLLTAAGRQRLGYQRLTTITKHDIDALKDLATTTELEGNQHPALLLELHKMRTTLEDLLTDSASDAPPVLDPFTGQPLSQLPVAVKPARVPVAGPGEAEKTAKAMHALLRRANGLAREIEKEYEKQAGRPFDYRNELREEEEE